MDDSVIRSIARWPNVPAVFGYLALDRRGQWILTGHRLDHQKTVEFINRNYAQDHHGRWYFQNGPQRVYVTLDYTPWIYRLRNGRVETHAGHPADSVTSAWMDELGQLLLYTEHGIGLLHDQDLSEAVDSLVNGDGSQLDEQQVQNSLEQMDASGAVRLNLLLNGRLVPLAPIRSDAVPTRFHFDPCPVPRPEEAD